MRKIMKQNDGYVLPYVLIVFLVLSFTAVTICGVSLNNLRAQEQSVKQAQARYTAEGEIEKFVAELLKLQESDVDAGIAKDAFWGAFWDAVASGFGADVTVLENTVEVSPNGGQMTVQAQVSDACITAKLEFLVSEPELNDGNTQYAVKTESVNYDSYYISRSVQEGGTAE